MNPEEKHDLLAGYLGDELPPGDRERFEGYLASDPAFAQEVATMRRTLSEMRSLAEPVTIPVGAIPDRDFAGRAIKPRGTPAPRMVSLLRYAAVILFAFAAGYAARSFAGRATLTPSIGARRTAPDSASRQFERRFVEAYGRSTGGSDLARSLIALSRVTR